MTERPSGGAAPGADDARQTAPGYSGDTRTLEPVDRRGFFRAFSREAFHTASGVVGAADALRRGTAAATAELLRLGVAQPEDAAQRLDQLGLPGAALPTQRYRSAYRVDGAAIHLLDQTRLPEATQDLACRTGAEVAAAIRSGAASGAPLLAQLAAYGLAATAASVRAAKPHVRAATLRGTANALRNSNRTAAALPLAVDRVMARWRLVGELADGDVVADALRAEADAIATEAALDHARLARLGAAALRQPDGRALEVLTLGSTGALAGGTIGTALGVVQAVVAEGREVHVWVAETRPSLLGARVAAWELQRADVAFTVIVDGAVGWLLAGRPIDAVLVGADSIAASGDTLATTGTLAVATLASAAGVPVFVCTPTAAFDGAVPDGAALPREDRGPGEVIALRTLQLAPRDSTAANPAFDVTPAGLVSGFVTEEGVLRPPFPETLARAFQAHGRRVPRAEGEDSPATAVVERPEPVETAADRG